MTNSKRTAAIMCVEKTKFMTLTRKGYNKIINLYIE